MEKVFGYASTVYRRQLENFNETLYIYVSSTTYRPLYCRLFYPLAIHEWAVVWMKLTYDALFEILVETVVANLLQQKWMELLERFEVLEMIIYHVQVFARTICRSVIQIPLTTIYS